MEPPRKLTVQCQGAALLLLPDEAALQTRHRREGEGHGTRAEAAVDVGLGDEKSWDEDDELRFFDEKSWDEDEELRFFDIRL